MTPQEKGIELVNKHYIECVIDFYAAKRCALIAVNEIIETKPNYPRFVDDDNGENYWQQVKQEIEKL